MIDPQDLVGVSEIAERAGVSSGSAVVNWALRHDNFPKPVRVLKCGSLYLWPDVEAWLADRAARRQQQLEDRLAKLDSRYSSERAKLLQELQQ